MDANKQDQIDERQAAILLGLTTAELRRISRVSGLGRLETTDRSEQIVFTYDELRKVCLLAAPSLD